MNENDLNQVIDNAIDTPWGLYWVTFTVVLGHVVAIGTALVKFTKTPKDDEYLGIVQSLIQRFAFLQPRK